MEVDDTHILARRRRRRWVSIIAVVLPVIAAVGLVAWFIRTFVAPPTARIPSPMIQVSAPRPAPMEVQAPAAPRENPAVPAAKPAATVAPPSQPPVEVPVTTEPVPMIASLAFAPPARGFGAAPANQAQVAPDSAADMPRELAAPPADPIPLPPRRPPISVAAIAGEVPLPRPRPADAATEAQPARFLFDWLRPR
jgi:hypothetical protein